MRRRHHHRRVEARTALALAALLLAAGCSAASPRPGGEDARPRSVFFLTDLKGYLAPCGCTSRPLGGIDRSAGLMATEAKSAVASTFVVAGNLFYESEVVEPRLAAQDAARAQTVAQSLAAMKLMAAAPGPYDANAGEGLGALTGERTGAQLLELAGVALGVLPVAAGAEPTAVAAEAKSLRERGARRVIALVGHGLEAARAVAGADGAPELIIWGGGSLLRRSAERLGESFLVSADSQGRYLGRLDLYLPEGGQAAPLQDLDAGEDRETKLASLESRAKSYRARLERLRRQRGDESAAAAEIVAKKVAQLDARRARLLRTTSTAAPTDKDAFRLFLLPIEQSIEPAPAIAALRDAYDGRLAELNASVVAQVETNPERPAFLGSAACAECHGGAAVFWELTKHAHAFETLVEVGKDHDLKCVGCHSVGFDAVNGFASVPVPDRYQDVRCESCHGPGSFHVEETGVEDEPSVHLAVPEAVCVRCHNAEHSDLFEYSTYLEHVVGPGHGQPLEQSK